MARPTTETSIKPLTTATWPDLKDLFARPGDQSRCGCMWFRLTPKEFTATRAAELRETFSERAGTAPSPGLIAYDDGTPVGWVAVAPRLEHPRLRRSTVVVYDDAVPDCWSVSCFYIRPGHRGRGLSTALLAAAVDHAAAHGAAHVEGYPVEPSGRASSSSMFHGSFSLFRRAGFTKVGRRQGRPTVRLTLASLSG
ncbi:GNAT family N-acetyltransferase [Georgenia subflava]|uniref:GNAT family N-acetyltransferase n=1 Tax=Georgenia subflava TaxID=1622177 RepID=A0A6N7EB66_9MICO|nr:GNAT family N-acetyltransferase [Georgenia subflava]MPV35449.1 GNAT family N-acetyltransferase [Georgenia subflava]